MPESQPLISIITVCYNLVKNNRSETLKQCIESVQEQSYKNIEHLFIDGASDDGTVELLQEYAQAGLINYYSEPDQGVYDAMNKGVSKAKGDYLIFLNSDDFFYDPKGLELSIKQILQSGAAYSFADAIILYEDRSPYHWKANLAKLPFSIHYCHQTMLVKKELLVSNPFDTSYVIGADGDLQIKLFAQNVAYTQVEVILSGYRVGGLSSSNFELSRQEHSSAFYKHIGSKIGLSLQDCYDFYQTQCFYEKSPEYCIKLFSRLYLPEWIEYAMYNLLVYLLQKNPEQ